MELPTRAGQYINNISLWDIRVYVILDFGHHNIKMLHMRCLLLGLKAESGEEEGSGKKKRENYPSRRRWSRNFNCHLYNIVALSISSLCTRIFEVLLRIFQNIHMYAFESEDRGYRLHSRNFVSSASEISKWMKSNHKKQIKIHHNLPLFILFQEVLFSMKSAGLLYCHTMWVLN